MNSFTIKLFKSGRKANFYTIQYDQETLSEIERFLENYHISHADQVNIIVAEMQTMINKYGADYNFFRSEGRDFLIALPKKTGVELRLYCIWVNREIVILGNGGLKKTRTFQEDTYLRKIAENLQEVNKLFEERKKNGEIWIEGSELKGNLHFEIITDEE